MSKLSLQTLCMKVWFCNWCQINLCLKKICLVRTLWLPEHGFTKKKVKKTVQQSENMIMMIKWVQWVKEIVIAVKMPRCGKEWEFSDHVTGSREHLRTILIQVSYVLRMDSKDCWFFTMMWFLLPPTAWHKIKWSGSQITSHTVFYLVINSHYS